MDLGSVLVVLHRPSSAENIGAAARVLKNFGLSRLLLVAPPSWSGPPRGNRDGVTGREAVMQRARTLARKATDLLETAKVHPDICAALGEAVWTVGTSSRTVAGRPRLSPRELAEEAARRASLGPVAVVFGEERRGLSDRELNHCQAVCTIPTCVAYDSMNLAQAVAVICYELALEARSPPAAHEQPAPPARHATLEALWERLRSLLAQVGYLNPQNPEHILADWRKLLARAEPTQREVELLLAAARQLERAVRRE